MPVQAAQLNRTPLAASGAGEAPPRVASRDGCADRGIEPQGSAAGLPCVPDSDDLLGFGNRLALGLSALGFLRRSGGGSLTFLRSALGPIREG